MMGNTIKGMKAYWDEIGDEEDAKWHIAHINEPEEFFASGKNSLEWIFPDGLDAVTIGSTVLEIGCGQGRISQAFANARSDVRIFGLDVSNSMIKNAVANNTEYTNLNFVVGDGHSFSCFCDEMFDLVYSYIVFQHLPRHIVSLYMSDVARILKPNGTLVFQVQSRERPQEIDPPYDNFRSIRYYTPAQAQALVRAPLKIISTRGSSNDHNFFVVAEKSPGSN